MINSELPQLVSFPFSEQPKTKFLRKVASFMNTPDDSRKPIACMRELREIATLRAKIGGITTLTVNRLKLVKDFDVKKQEVVARMNEVSAKAIKVIQRAYRSSGLYQKIQALKEVCASYPGTITNSGKSRSLILEKVCNGKFCFPLVEEGKEGDTRVLYDVREHSPTTTGVCFFSGTVKIAPDSNDQGVTAPSRVQRRKCPKKIEQQNAPLQQRRKHHSQNRRNRQVHGGQKPVVITRTRVSVTSLHCPRKLAAQVLARNGIRGKSCSQGCSFSHAGVGHLLTGALVIKARRNLAKADPIYRKTVKSSILWRLFNQVVRDHRK